MRCASRAQQRSYCSLSRTRLYVVGPVGVIDHFAVLKPGISNVKSNVARPTATSSCQWPRSSVCGLNCLQPFGPTHTHTSFTGFPDWFTTYPSMRHRPGSTLGVADALAATVDAALGDGLDAAGAPPQAMGRMTAAATRPRPIIRKTPE